jgi:hypothetical protein
MANPVLERAITLIEQGWTQGKLARDENGSSIYHGSSRAVSWCLVGGLLEGHDRLKKETGAGDSVGRMLSEAITSLARVICARTSLEDNGDGNSLSSFNDHIAREAGEVLSVMREANK